MPSQAAPSAATVPRLLAVNIHALLLRPLTFRIFTKKYNLTLKLDALVLLLVHWEAYTIVFSAKTSLKCLLSFKRQVPLTHLQ